jgi:UDP-N-acetylglucosamine/UDP-N-acetylgalactosamine diphosphorylase
MASVGPAKPDIRELRALFEAHDQGHVFRFWDGLGEDAQSRLEAQAASLDLPALLRGFRATQEAAPQHVALEPPEVVALPDPGADAERHRSARERGQAMLAGGRVAVMVVAGGQGSRLGFPGPKGLFPLGPVSGRTLFAQQAQKLRRLRDRFGVAIPWYVMTSAATDTETRRAFEAEKCYGLPESDVFFLRQGMLPAFDPHGKLILERPDRIFENPDGHGGALTALLSSGALDDMRSRGITTIFYYQVDNPLVPLGDTALLGFHAEAAAQASCKSLRKREPGEKVGVLARIDGRMGVVEYTEITPEQRDARDAQGELRFSAGNTAVHAFEVDFVRRIAAEAEHWLPLHASAKKIPYVDDLGVTKEPDAPNGFKLERFVFDALRAADSVCVVEASRDEYAPVKNATGPDSPQTSRQALSDRYRSWIAGAGLTAPPADHWIEIDESRIGGPEDLRSLDLNDVGDASDSILLTRLGDDV